jgi:hypothetical protein
MAFMFEKLEVYQKSVDFADDIAAMTEGFPRDRVGWLSADGRFAVVRVSLALCASGKENLWTVAHFTRYFAPTMNSALNLDGPSLRLGDSKPCLSFTSVTTQSTLR